MKHIEIFAQWLVDGGYGILGQNIFVHHMPETCEKGILIKDSLIGTDYDSELDGHFCSHIQIILRDSDIPRIKNESYSIMNFLTRRQEGLFTITIPPKIGQKIFVKQVLPEKLPLLFPRSDGDFRESSINLKIWYSDVN